MTEHTPGPWNVSDKYDNEIDVVAPWSEVNKPETSSGYGSYLGIHVCKIDHQNDNPCVLKSVATANANLIAAAPELLSFVEKMERMLICERDCYYEGCSTPDGTVPDQHDKDILKSMDADIDEARALITKARGVK